MTLIKCQNIEHSYPATDDPAGPPLTVLRGVDFAMAPGESAAIVGPSGSGKSTLLHLMGALAKPTAGKIIFENQDIGVMDDAALAQLRSRRIGFVFQFHHLLPQCTVLENVLVPTIPIGLGAAKEAQPRARKLLERVGLADRMQHRPGQLSGGERQRVAVVRALINQPALLLADEPTGALDQEHAVNLVELLAELNRDQSVAVVMVTHARDLARRMQTVYTIESGTLHKAEDAT